MPLPPNVEMAHRLLLEAAQPIDVGELSDRLRDQGVVQPPSALRRYVERFPEEFVLSEDDKLSAVLGAMVVGNGAAAAVSGHVPDERAEAGQEGPDRWWTRAPEVERIPTDRIAVVALGEEPGEDGSVLLSLAVASFDGDERQHATVRVVEGALADEGRDLLDTLFCEYDALVGFHPSLRELRELGEPTKQGAVQNPVPPVLLDLVLLSIVVEPCLGGRSLYELAAALGLQPPDERTLADELGLMQAAGRELLQRFTAEEPSFALARRLLAKAGSPWAAVVGAAELDGKLTEILVPRSDPLVARAGPRSTTSARDAVDAGLAAFGASNPHFVERPGQRQMAELVAATLDRDDRLMIEAPTGTGKSLAYLIPATGRATRRPVVVATHTKVLQRQLRDDAEQLRRLGVLGVPFRQVAGVANYLCTREIADTIEHDHRDPGAMTAAAVAVRALATAPNGVWDDVSDQALRSYDLGYAVGRSGLSTEAGLCERTDCDWAANCPLMARVSDLGDDPGIIATNHAVVARWLASEDQATAPGRLFTDEVPTALVVDEAHNLEDSLSAAFTQDVGAATLRVLVDRIWGRNGPVARLRGAPNVDDAAIESLDELRSVLPSLARQLGDAVEEMLHEYGGRSGTIVLRRAVVHNEHFRAVESAAFRCARALGRLRGALLAAAIPAVTALRAAGAIGRSNRLDRLASGSGQRLEELVEVLDGFAEVREPHRLIHVLSAGERVEGDPRPVSETWRYECTPIEAGQLFGRRVSDRSSAVVLTSATLRVRDDFSYLAGRLGVTVATDTGDGEYRGEWVMSPFDYDRNSAVVLTSHLVHPSPTTESEFIGQVATDQTGFVSLSGGRTLTLFASRARMEAVAELVEQKKSELADRGVTLLLQHREAPGEIRHRFRSDPGTVAFGLRSYWEGFDAPGETLSYLFIEKPPFPHPGDALSAARQQAIVERGGDAFTEYVLPRTAILMAQGFGRLLRRETDRGVALVYDRRFQQGWCGELLEALPTSNVHAAADRDDAWSFALQFVTGEEPDLSQAIELVTDVSEQLLDDLRLEPGEDPTAKLVQAARELFGIEQLHDAQLDLMRAVLSGRDAMGFLPTGMGKSLCFQLPALLNAERRPYVVVSPLVALIKDQVDSLRSERGLRRIFGITMRTSVAERTEALRDLYEGRINLLYISPERLVRDPVLRLALNQQELGCLTVDEAHCISAWGHDFRPEFRQIARAVADFRRSPRLALTATATPEVESDIAGSLEMVDPFVVRKPTDRVDLSYSVLRCDSERARARELLRFVTSEGDAPGIVYASRRALTEELAWMLRQIGVSARSYHAGMLPEQRESVQDDFLAGTTQVVVATKAFGMGVDKADIEWVLHYDLPESLEAYAQESGRAARARDATGRAVLLWLGGDVARRRRHLSQEARAASLEVAEKCLAALRSSSKRRGEDVLVVAEDLAEELQIEPDELNVLLAWLEEAGVLVRRPDCITAGHVTLGRVEPQDPEELATFLRLVKTKLNCRLGVRRRLELDAEAERLGVTADELEQQLTEWSLSRYITFAGTQRAWRVALLKDAVDASSFNGIVRRWRQLQRSQLEGMLRYVESGECRRLVIARQFGDRPSKCGESGALPCDVCAGGAPTWHSVPLSRVPDPESFVDVEVVVLQAVAWASRNTTRPFSEGTIKAVLLGKEFRGDHPVSPAALRCPQFAALRHVRGAERRFDEVCQKLIAARLIERFDIGTGERPYASLRITEAGRRQLGA